ncbi:rhodanese-like domain-containing protein [Palleronia pelagia]|uniref:Rhodanese-related sulfurtransferase n=1 Tax=Palleronia pelagia TaxID=387096 RepID=A0A1H8D9D1_9RHOB|nr:rhodanese-like domain-containing protein [Palleronia pelagia]SEN03971.1 Rhodanese-related sulfurtransferase [Palleronia pelagia]
MPITPVADLVRAAKGQVTTLSLEDARAEADAGRALLVDIRDVRELAKTGRIPGAVHAPRGMLEFWVDPESPYHKPDFATDKRIVLFCASAWRSALAAKTLQDMGVENVAEMDGGFSAWKDAGLPVEQA